MQVILLERVAKLGQMGDVVNVKPGFARNFLLPKGKALRATEENRKRFETQRVQPLQTLRDEVQPLDCSTQRVIYSAIHP